MIGRTGRVTGRVGPGLVGEVMIEIRGGIEAFYAYPADPEQFIEPGTDVLVVGHQPPRSVHVEPWLSIDQG